MKQMGFWRDSDAGCVWGVLGSVRPDDPFCN